MTNIRLSTGLKWRCCSLFTRCHGESWYRWLPFSAHARVHLRLNILRVDWTNRRLRSQSWLTQIFVFKLGLCWTRLRGIGPWCVSETRPLHALTRSFPFPHTFLDYNKRFAGEKLCVWVCLNLCIRPPLPLLTVCVFISSSVFVCLPVCAVCFVSFSPSLSFNVSFCCVTVYQSVCVCARSCWVTFSIAGVTSLLPWQPLLRHTLNNSSLILPASPLQPLHTHTHLIVHLCLSTAARQANLANYTQVWC